jgi:drug/metabolite transporter (DMT)-like permease
MLDILLTVIAFNILIIIFKFFHKFNIDNLQALIVNYFTAGLCGIYFSDQEFSITYIINAPWFLHAAVIGILFIVVFNFYATGTQKVGIAITTIANKLSLFVPVGFALMLYNNEELTLVKIIGFILAVIGIYLSSTKNKKLSFNKKYLWLIIIVFAGQGIADTIFNHAQQTLVGDEDKALFFTVLFMMAGTSGIFILLGKSIKKRQKIEFKNILGGFIFGLPNFASLIFFFNALESSGFAASQVFPVVSMGVVVVSALIGLILFKEKLSTMNWIGLGFAVLSIYLITFL